MIRRAYYYKLLISFNRRFIMYTKMEMENKNYLEPYISKETMDFHYQLYSRYYDKLIKLLKEQNYNYQYSKEELFNHIDIFPIQIRDDILFNLGGVINHELYFNTHHKGLKKTSNIIIQHFGSMENLKKQWIETANSMVGSGYTYLVINKEKQLEILNFSNQDSPYIYGLIPILALDLWEHSYYLDYNIDRRKYIDNLFEAIDFEQVDQNYEKSIKLL